MLHWFVRSDTYVRFWDAWCSRTVWLRSRKNRRRRPCRWAAARSRWAWPYRWTLARSVRSRRRCCSPWTPSSPHTYSRRRSAPRRPSATSPSVAVFPWRCMPPRSPCRRHVSSPTAWVSVWNWAVGALPNWPRPFRRVPVRLWPGNCRRPPCPNWRWRSCI